MKKITQFLLGNKRHCCLFVLVVFSITTIYSQDTDGDGVADATDICAGFDDLADADNDNVPDGCDQDDDNDGILDTIECPFDTIDFSSIIGGSRLVAGDPSVNFSTNSSGPLTSVLTLSAPTPVGGAADVNIESELGGTVLRFEDDNGFRAGEGVSSTITLSNPSTITFAIDASIGNSNINQSDQLVLTAVGASTDFNWMVTSSNNATITRAGDTVTITGSSTAGGGGTGPFAEFSITASEPISQVSVSLINNITLLSTLNSGRFSVSICPDSDGDGLENFVDGDSDNDGCSDANEAYNNPNADGGDGEQFGAADPATVDPANGLVTESGIDYTLGTNAEVTNAAVNTCTRLTGKLYIDTNGNGVQDNGELNLSGVDVSVTDANGIVRTERTANNGVWVITSLAPGNATVDVDDTDLPAGATQTEGTDPSVHAVVTNTIVNAGADGYTFVTPATMYQTPSCIAGTVYNFDWDTSAPNGVNEFDWTSDGTITDTFSNVDGSGIDMTMAFSGNTADLGRWSSSASGTADGVSPQVGTNATLGNKEVLQLFTMGTATPGITQTISFGAGTTIFSMGFDLYNIDRFSSNGDKFTITATDGLGNQIFPVFTTAAAAATYTVDNSTGIVEAVNRSTDITNSQLGVNFESFNGIASITIVWDNCDACSPVRHGYGFGNLSFCTEIPTPNLSLEKTGIYVDVNGDGLVNLGDRIDYTFVVRNSGNVDLTSIRIEDPLLVTPNGSLSGSAIDLGAGDDDLTTFTGSYTIQQSDINRGFVVNSATATGSSPGNTDDVTDVSDDPTDTTDTTDTDNDGDFEDDTETILTQSPNLSLEKTGVYVDANGDGLVNLGDRIDYTFVVRNTGNVDLGDIRIEDSLLEDVNGSLSGTRTLPLGAGDDDLTTFTGSYAIQQSDINRGFVVNSATAIGSSPGNTDDVTDVSDDPTDTTDTTDTDNDGDFEDDTETILTQSPNLSLEKTGVYVDVNGNGIVNLGDRIDYTFVVRNTGNVDLRDIRIEDPLLVGPNGSLSGMRTLPLGAGLVDTDTFTGSYTIQQSDINRGFVVNSATATGSSPGNTDDVTDVSDDPTDTTDTTDTDNDGDFEDDTETILTQSPNLSLEKTGVYVDANGDGLVNLGDRIDYTFVVRNTGNVDLGDIRIEDSLLEDVNGSLSGTRTLPLGAGDDDLTTFTGSYAIQQSDINNGFVVNSATAIGSSPGNTDDVTDVSDDPTDTTDTTDTDNDGDFEDDTETILTQSPNLSLEKTGVYVDANGDGLVNLGDRIDYTFVVRNTGNVDLRDIRIEDPLLVGPNGSLSGMRTLPLGAGLVDTDTFTGSYTIQQSDINRGFVVNSATAIGSSPGNTDDVTDVSDDPTDTTDTTDTDNDGDFEDDTETILTQSPNLSLEKTGVYVDANGDGLVNLGDRIDYTFVVRNTGNVDLGDIRIEDSLLEDVNGSLSGTRILPLEAGDDDLTTFTGSYTIQQSDINRGFVVNSATAIGSSPGNTDDVTDVSDDPTDTTDTTDTDNDGDFEDDTETILTQSPNLSLEKTGVYVDANGDGIVNLGDRIDYTFVVRNTGNVDLGDIRIEDSLLEDVNGSLSGTRTLPLGAGDDDLTTFTGSYAIQQSDINRGFVVNSATAIGSSPGNTDDVTDVSDDPTDTTDTTDTDNDGDFEDDTETILTQSPNLSLEKTGIYVDVNGNGIVDTNDRIDYTFVVRNTGNVDLGDIRIEDSLLEDVNGSLSGTRTLPLGAGDDDLTTFTGSYAIQQSDINRGFVVNSATAIGSSPGNTDDVTDVSDDPTDTTDTTDTDNDGDFEDDTETILIQTSSLELVKTSVVNGTNVGDTIDYTFTVTNRGNVTIDDIRITDPLLGSAQISITPPSLDPEEVGVATATYTLTQSNVDDGRVVNSATVTGSSPGNTNDVTDVSDSGDASVDENDDGDPTNDETISNIGQTATLELVKTAVVNGSNEGDTIDYTFTVTNTGSVTISGISIDDPLTGSVALALSPALLGPGDVGVATAVYTLTQSDVDNGQVINSATVTGSSPGNTNDVTDVSDSGDASVDENIDGDPTNDETISMITQIPNLELLKEGKYIDVNGDQLPNVGDRIDYTFTITNTGNVRITNIIIEDPLPGVLVVGDSIDLAVGETDSNSFTASYILTGADVLQGNVRNQATVIGMAPDGSEVTDLSDSVADTTNVDLDNDGDAEDVTVTEIAQQEEIVVYTSVSPNGDNINDEFTIVGLEDFPDNTLRIFNRWGVKVFDKEGYMQPGVAKFKGVSNGRVTIAEKDELPVGTYYYIVEYVNASNSTKTKSGYLYINR